MISSIDGHVRRGVLHRLWAVVTGFALIAGVGIGAIDAAQAAIHPTPRSAISPVPTDAYLDLNGSGNLVSTPIGSAFSPEANSTFEVWVKPTSCAVQCTVFVQKSQYSLFIRNGAWFLSLNSGSLWTEFALPPKPVYGQWTHLAWSRSGVSNAVYFNGQAIKTFTYSGGFGPANVPMDIGGSTLYSAEYFVGAIDELRIWNSARSQLEIASDMNTYADVNSPNLKVYYDFNEGSGSTLYNSKVGASADTSAAIWGPPKWRTIDTTMAKRGDSATRIVTFERSYINSRGGWTPPSGVTAVSAFAVGGGGSGASNVGGGGGGGGSASAQFNPTGVIKVTVGAPGRTGVSVGNPNVPDPGMSATAGTPSVVDWTTSSITAPAGGGGLTLSSALKCDAALPLVGTGGAGGVAGQSGSVGGSGGTGRGDRVDGMAGGAGSSSPFTGDTVSYGGGGGAGAWSARFGVGGAGGGGNGGGSNGTTYGMPAVPNSGGGGGGAPAGCGPGGSGATGVVMLSYAGTSNGECSPTVSYYSVGATSYTVATFIGATTCTWTPPAGITSIDYVVVGAGGGGGANVGGGGGGGGVSSGTVTIAERQPLTLTIGAGGVGGVMPGAANDPGGAYANGAVGGSTTVTFSDSTSVGATGGRGGATYWSNLRCTGGNPVGVGTGGAGGTPVGSAGSPGGAGATSGVNNGAPGGAGVATTIANGASSYFGGGGGSGTWNPGTPSSAGGTGGVGGGGKGGYASGVAAASGVPGSGGGGGGGATICSEGGSGGSGTVIVRIAQAGATSPCLPSYSTDGAYTVATITTVGNCAFQRPVGVYRADVLVVGGGGGGGSWVAGGGGGGGVMSKSSVSLDASTLVTVGAGGVGATGAGAVATFASNGSRSAFGSLNALGGGRGGSWRPVEVPIGSIPVASLPGSAVTEQVATGGGASGNWNNWAVARLGGTGTLGQGFAGGNAASRQGPPTFGDPFTGGGGGGAGSAGVDANVNGIAGDGGNGVASSITGVPTYFGGGGGGATHNYTNGFSRQPGSGGLGGGGNGWSDNTILYPASAGNGADGFGGGGGAVAGRGDWLGQRAGRGGSGTVILRYQTTAPADVSYLSIRAGNNQTDVRGQRVFSNPSVVVKDAAGNPKSGVTVSFAAVTGGGSVGSASDITDVNGVASTTWTLGPATGSNTMTASVVAGENSPVTFTASAITPVPTALQVFSGDAQSATVGTAVANAPVVKVVDGLSDPVEDVLVSFRVIDGGGSVVSQTAVMTDASGLATAPAWTLGTLTGTNTLRAVADYQDSIAPLDISATATAGASAGLRITTQPGSAVSGQLLGTQPILQLIDTYGNDVTVSAISVAVDVAIGIGTVAATNAVSDAQGIVTFTDATVSGTPQGYALGFTSPGMSSVVSDTFEVSKLPQTLTFGPLTGAPFSSAAFGDAPLSLAGSASASSTLTPVYSSKTPSVCGASNATIVIVGGGTCTIQADQPGDATYAEAPPLKRSFTVVKGAQSALTLADTTIDLGQSATMVALGGSGNGAVAYSGGGGTAECSVDASTGIVTTLHAGTCMVSAVKAGSATYLDGSPVNATVTVNQGSQSVSFASTVPRNPLPMETYSVSATSSAGLPVEFDVAASDPGVCSIRSGVVTFAAAGRCIVTASQSGNADYSAATSSVQDIVVGALNQSITFDQPVDFELGSAARQLKATATSGRLVVFARGAGTTNGACTVTPAGVVSPVAVGACEVVASQSGTQAHAAASEVIRLFEILPAAPAAPYITSFSSANGTATIVFNGPGFDGGSAVSGYEISAKKESGAFPIVKSRDCAAGTSPMTCTITGLSVGMTYTLWVSAINGVGIGVPSNRVGPVQAAIAPQGVMQLTATTSGTSLYATWVAPLDLGGGTFVRYDVSIRPSDGEWGTPEVETGLFHVFTGLASGSYEVKVVTITSVDGDELQSNTVSATQIPITAASVPPPTLTPRGPGEVLVTWPQPKTDGGAPIIGYDVIIHGPDGDITCTPPAGANACLVKGLNPGDEYTVSVLPTNESAVPEEVPTTFVAPMVPSAPKIVKAIQGKTGITVNWIAPKSDGGATIVGYTVTATPLKSKAKAKTQAKTIKCTGLPRSCVITTKVRASSFVFTVVARNIVGPGKTSAGFSVQGKAVPGVVNGVATGSTLTVTWTNPKQPAGIAPVASYKVSIKKGKKWSKPVVVKAGKPLKVAFGRQKFKQPVTVRVIAVSSKGKTVWQATKKIAVARKAPGAVTALMVTASATGTVVLAWKAPADIGSGPIVSYRVNGRLSSVAKYTRLATVNQTTATVAGLKPGSRYYFAVVAVNDAGSGKWTKTPRPIRIR